MNYKEYIFDVERINGNDTKFLEGLEKILKEKGVEYSIKRRDIYEESGGNNEMVWPYSSIEPFFDEINKRIHLKQTMNEYYAKIIGKITKSSANIEPTEAPTTPEVTTTEPTTPEVTATEPTPRPEPKQRKGITHLHLYVKNINIDSRELVSEAWK